jgi:hypothetical protein
MKKALLLIISCIIGLISYTQITIQRSDYFDVGDEIKRINFEFSTPVSIDEIITSPLVFTTYANGEITIDTLEIFSPETVDENEIFTDATCAYDDGNTGEFSFLNISENKTELIGFFINMMDLVQGQIVLDEPLTLYNYPVSYGNSPLVDAQSGNMKVNISMLEDVLDGILPGLYTMLSLQYDSVMLTVDMDIVSDFDEFGNMNIIGNDILEGTFEYMREKQRIIMKSDIFFRERSSGDFIQFTEALVELEEDIFPIIDTTCTYNYWVNDYKYPLVEINLNTDYTVVYDITLRYAGEVGVGCINSLEIYNCLAYPNPAGDLINFNLENYSDCKLQIYSTLGSLIIESSQNQENTTIDISEYQSGIYYYKVLDKKGNTVSGGKFIKQ